MRKNFILFTIFLLINFIFFEFIFGGINFQKEEYLRANYVDKEIGGTILNKNDPQSDQYQGNLKELKIDLDSIGEPYIIFYETIKDKEKDVYVYTKDYEWQFNKELKEGSYYDSMSDKTYHTMDINQSFNFQFIFFQVQNYTETEVHSYIKSDIQAFGYYSDYEPLDNTMIFYTFSILIIVLITILQIYLENSKEEIIVLKLLGNNTSKIVDKVIRKIILILLATFSIISILYIKDIYIILKINKLRHLFLEFLIYFTTCQILIISICALHLAINISKKNVIEMLRGGKYD